MSSSTGETAQKFVRFVPLTCSALRPISTKLLWYFLLFSLSSLIPGTFFLYNACYRRSLDAKHHSDQSPLAWADSSFGSYVASLQNNKNNDAHSLLKIFQDQERRRRLDVNSENAAEVPDCFLEGTVSGTEKQKPCKCRQGWNGVGCSIPDAVWFTDAFQDWYLKGLIKRRSRPRAIINGLVFNHELDLFEIRVKELGDAVDYYVVVESNYTYFGSTKPLHFRSNMSAGFLREHAHKIVPIAVGFYNYEYGSPWAPENYFRSSIWREGQSRLKNLRDDDLFMILDADEIPSRDVLLFLKYHDGYGEPMSLKFRSFLYGFFWTNYEPVEVGGVCTVAALRHLYWNDSLLVRRAEQYFPKTLPYTGTVKMKWSITGTEPRYAGWHCSWCFEAHGIQVKLASAQRDDGVRWGDFANKTDLAYIESIRKAGRYFDDSSLMYSCDALEVAPPYVKDNADRFQYLMKL
uniref:Putative conserved secreted protein n=1 Tax=Amblyomma aureolatum TaxID=187763 RepID=A0A1E1X6L5_9ACAR